jgi:hypothetical protein
MKDFINQRSFSVVNVCDDRNIPDLLHTLLFGGAKVVI